jgi:hypothetical protein
MENSGRDQLEGMLDDALSVYSGAEPLAGLEDRVLHRLRTIEATRRRPPGWAFAFVAAAALALVAIVMTVPRNPAPKPRDIARTEVPAPARPVVVEEPRVARKHRHSRITARRASFSEPLPKQEQFPTPAALTAEEQALRSFVERDPAQAQQVFAQLRKRTNDPIEIQPIQIAPLQINAP